MVVWFHRTGHEFVRFPFRPWYPKKEEPSFADMLTTLRRLSYEEKTEGVLANPILTENLDCPAHRASQPDRVSRTIGRGFPAHAPRHDRSAGANFDQPGRSRSVFKSAKLELESL